MTKQTWILPILMILSIALSGCGLGFEGAGPEAEALAPLNAADWPTPLPTTLPATPTPFPKVTLAPTATPSPRPAAAATPTPLAMAGLSFGGSIDDLVEKVTASSGGLAPVAAAMVTAGDAAVRQGPGVSYASMGVAKPGELAGVLGMNAGGDWLYVLTISQLQGWLPKNTLRVTGTLDKAPVLPPDPLAEDVAQSDPSSPAAPADGSDASASDAGGSLPLPVTELAPVTKARVDNDQLNIRQGPGAAYELLGALSRDDEVTVLALNILGDWVLVETAAGQFGWVSLAYLALEGSVADAPQVLSPAPSRTLPPGQVAPIFPASVESNPTSGPSASANPGAGTAGQGKLVFQLSSGGDVMVINPDGTGLRRLTYGIDPVLAPDGQTVAFTRWTGEEGSLWLIGVDGTGERQVLDDTRQAKHPAWSPDGEQIVVNFQDGGRLDPKDVCKSLIELGDKTPNIPFNAEDVEVKVIDGDPHLCWTLPPDPHWGLRTVRVADGSFADVPSDDYAFGPEWDPANAWRIVSSGLDGLVQLDVNRRQQWGLTDRREDHTPAFSPDGRYLAVAWRNNSGQYDIHRLNSDGSGRVPLTKIPLWVTAVPDEQQPWNNVAPAWSPDGSQIAFISDRGGRWEIWVMNADGSNQRPMFPDEVNDQLTIVYDFVDERVLSWR